MICTPCARAADSPGEVRVYRCAACKWPKDVYPRSEIIVHHRVKSPTGEGPRVKCPGSGKRALITGHNACTGCDCQHHPAGTRQRKDTP